MTEFRLQRRLRGIVRTSLFHFKTWLRLEQQFALFVNSFISDLCCGVVFIRGSLHDTLVLHSQWILGGSVSIWTYLLSLCQSVKRKQSVSQKLESLNKSPTSNNVFSAGSKN